MGKTSVIFFLLFLIGIIVFGFFNPEIVTIKIPGGGAYEVSKFILVLFSIAIGVFITFIFFAIRDTKKFIDNWQLQRRQKQESKVQELYSRALNAILAHKMEEAREALEGILAEEPDHVAALLRLGDVYAAGDEFQKANTYYQKARMISPQNLETLFSMETNLEKTGRWADALKYLQDILDIDEDNLAAMYRQRLILEKQGRWDELVSVQKTILKHEHAEKDKKREQQNLIGYEYEYGRHSLENNQLEKAKKAFKTILRIEKDFIPATLGLAEVMLREGESEEGVNLLEKTFETTDSKIVLARLEDLLISLGEPGRLISLYKSTLSRKPNDVVIRFFLAKLYYRLEMIDDALETLAGMDTGGILYPEFHQLLGNLHMRRNQFEKAVVEFKKAVDMRVSLRLPYCCSTCGFSSPEWAGRCPDCRQWDTYQFNLDGICRT